MSHRHECHDPNCSCHEHEHHHGHECSDPNCSCHEHEHESAAEKTVSGSFVISRTRELRGEITGAALQKRMERLFLALGEKANFEGIIPGHIKGVAELSTGERLGASVTRPGTVDFVPAAGWSAESKADGFTLTVNVMLLTDAGLTEDDLFAGVGKE